MPAQSMKGTVQGEVRFLSGPDPGTGARSGGEERRDGGTDLVPQRGCPGLLAAPAGGRLAAEDLVGERGVVLGAPAGGGVLEDRLAEARTLGQPDVAPDSGPEERGVRPRGVGVPA